MNEAKLIKLQTKKLINGMQTLALDETKASEIMSFLQLLQKWNKAYNLTAIDQLEDMVTHHALDALSVLKYFTASRVIDVGTGAGIPGFLIAIMQPETEVVLLDAVGKKARFMRHVKRALKLDNAEIVHARVENYFPDEKFDVVTSRAFSEMSQFLNLTAHLVKPNGVFMAMKGPRNEPIGAGMPFEQMACWDIEVPFLNESRKLYQIRMTTEQP